MVSPVPEESVTFLDNLERRVKALASISPERYISIRLDQLTALSEIARAAEGCWQQFAVRIRSYGLEGCRFWRISKMRLLGWRARNERLA